MPVYESPFQYYPNIEQQLRYCPRLFSYLISTKYLGFLVIVEYRFVCLMLALDGMPTKADVQAVMLFTGHCVTLHSTETSSQRSRHFPSVRSRQDSKRTWLDFSLILSHHCSPLRWYGPFTRDKLLTWSRALRAIVKRKHKKEYEVAILLR